MTISCKKNSCPGTVEFDGEITIPGNFKTVQLFSKKHFQVKIEGALPDQLAIGSLKITQGLHAEVQDQIIRFHFDKYTSLKKDTFYLTCTEGHTLPYDIIIENV